MADQVQHKRGLAVNVPVLLDGQIGYATDSKQLFIGNSGVNEQVGIHSTSDISEGTNLYYTDARADARITIQKGVASGLATLDASGKVPASELPAVSPLTAKGDLYGFDTANQRIPVGSNGQVLTADSTQALGVKWSPSSGGGGGGINYIGLDASYAGTNPDDKNAENSLGQWAAYNNTVAGVSPDAGMTGGTPSGNVLLTRTTAAGQVLDGIASFLITKAAFNVQGEGFSVIANVPPAFRTQNTTISIPFKVISGNYVQGDLKVFLYDVTNSQVITPFNNDVVGSQGVITAIAQLSTNTAQIRVGFHFASTVATALTIAFDDVSVGPNQAAMGMAGSNPLSDRAFPLGTGPGTVTNLSQVYWRVGKMLRARIQYTTGSLSVGQNITVQMPTGLTIDYSSNPTATSAQVGTFAYSAAAGAQFGRPAFTDGSSNSVFAGLATASTQTHFGKATYGTDLISSGDTATWDFEVPIAGWDANVTMAQSSTFKISSFLANGTLVSGRAPNVLGEYRALARSAGSTFTYTDTTVTNPPNNNDGIRIDSVNTLAAADAAGFPSAFDIFLGKNKNFKQQFNSLPGRTGFADVSPSYYTTVYNIGVTQSYDPTTGIFSIRPNVTNGNSNILLVNNGTGGQNTGYFDITVSENALAVGVQAPRSEIKLSTYAGYGSVDTMIPYFTTAVTTGTAMTLTTNQATNGAAITINEDGIYSATILADSPTGVNALQSIGFTLNETAANRTAPVYALAPFAPRLAAGAVYANSNGGDSFANASWSGVLHAGDVVRPHGTGAIPTSVTNFQMSIVKVSN